MTGHTANTGHTRALDTERESQVTHGDLDHGVRVHITDVTESSVSYDKILLLETVLIKLNQKIFYTEVFSSLSY